MAGENNKGEKTRWEKAEILLKPAGALFAAITVALIGLMGRTYMERRQNNEMRLRLFTELMSQREQAESALRKDMFRSIMDSFLEPGSKSIEPQLLQLELLAHNFHESLNLAPLFLHLKRRIHDDAHESLKTKAGYRKRLEKVAREIIAKQVSILEVAGFKVDQEINLESLLSHPEGEYLEYDSLCIGWIERDVQILVSNPDTAAKELKVEMEITAVNDLDDRAEAKFSVGVFDFPMIDNTRLSHDERCALVLKTFEYPIAVITLVYFPGSHASLKEKPYYQEMLSKLLCEPPVDE